MVETRRSSAAAAAAKRPSPSPSSSSVPPPKRPKAEAPPSPTTSAPGRTEEDSAAPAAARSTGSAEDTVAQKDHGEDKPASAAAESSKRKKEPEQQQPTAPWAKLLSQCSQTPHLPISAPQFSVGQSKNCNLCLKDEPVSKMLCKLRRLEQGGQCELQVIGKKGMVQLNGRTIDQGTKVPLTGGDEVVFSSCGKHAYIFQHPLSDKIPLTLPSSAISILEAPVKNVKKFLVHHPETREHYSYRMDEISAELNILERIIDGTEEPSNLKLPVLRLITRNFSDELKIGDGGCGVVYKGILGNRTIAVKKLFNSHTIDEKMFRQEVTSMMMVSHKNIVRLLGYCSHTEEKAMNYNGNIVMAQQRERLLCLEYIINGSLENHLTDELRGLEWHVRYQIIKGICEGLHHLHKDKHIVHMDLKPANILLDDHMMPKVTDFGLSRRDDTSRTMSVERLLTLGYCAPEYRDHGIRSAKSDIYSLGVIILELVSGSKEKPSIAKILRRWTQRWKKSAKDMSLSYQQVKRCLDLAQSCLNPDPKDRPHIWDIMSDLNKADTTVVYTNDTECLELEEMLGIEPLQVHLPFKLNKQISCSIELTNDTDDYFAFRISTTSLRPYHIHPIKDIVPPRSKCSVTITLQARDKAPLHNQCKDEFIVQSTKVEGSLTAMDISGRLFNEVPGKAVDEVSLTIVLEAP